MPVSGVLELTTSTMTVPSEPVRTGDVPEKMKGTQLRSRFLFIFSGTSPSLASLALLGIPDYPRAVPELSRFYGIIIRMFVEVGGQHHRPHFHAYYQDAVAVFGIDPLELISGELPTRQRRLVEAWAELHQPELANDWELLQAGQPPKAIEPLR